MPARSRNRPYPISEEGLIRLTRDRRYWDERHPEFPTYQRIVREGLDDDQTAIETRLRVFQDVPYRKESAR